MHILCVYLHQIARGIVLFLVNNLYEKRITESLEGRNFGAFFALLVICTRVKTLHMKNALVQTRFSHVHYHLIYGRVLLFVGPKISMIHITGSRTY